MTTGGCRNGRIAYIEEGDFFERRHEAIIEGETELNYVAAECLDDYVGRTTRSVIDVFIDELDLRAFFDGGAPADTGLRRTTRRAVEDLRHGYLNRLQSSRRLSGRRSATLS